VGRNVAATEGAWLALHRAYPGVPSGLLALSGEGADWAVLTTKGCGFARELFGRLQLSPCGSNGHEQGSRRRCCCSWWPGAAGCWFSSKTAAPPRDDPSPRPAWSRCAVSL